MKPSLTETLVRWTALLVIPPIAGWSVLDRFMDPVRFRTECWSTLSLGTNPMACSPGMFLVGMALVLGLAHLFIVIPVMAWIAATLRAGRTDARRVRRRGLLAFAIATPVFASIAVGIGLRLHDFLVELWVPSCVTTALSILFVTMPAWNETPMGSRPEVS